MKKSPINDVGPRNCVSREFLVWHHVLKWCLTAAITLSITNLIHSVLGRYRYNERGDWALTVLHKRNFCVKNFCCCCFKAYALNIWSEPFDSLNASLYWALFFIFIGKCQKCVMDLELIVIFLVDVQSIFAVKYIMLFSPARFRPCSCD